MCMYRNFLLDRGFWASPRKADGNQPKVYMKHDSTIGGIYAYLQHRGVKIVVDEESRFFNNFDRLEEYLEQLYLNSKNPSNQSSNFYRILNRRDTSKLLRQ